MAILKKNNISLVPLISSRSSRDQEPYARRGRTIYTRDCRFHNEDPETLIKWCRRNFGERGDGWDFTFVSGLVTIEIWNDRYKTMYTMWKT